MSTIVSVVDLFVVDRLMALDGLFIHVFGLVAAVFLKDNTDMLLGDAKATLLLLDAGIKEYYGA